MLYGAQYYRPPFPGRACWRRDLAHMKELETLGGLELDRAGTGLL